jgi:hypothetical protein
MLTEEKIEEIKAMLDNIDPGEVLTLPRGAREVIEEFCKTEGVEFVIKQSLGGLKVSLVSNHVDDMVPVRSRSGNTGQYTIFKEFMKSLEVGETRIFNCGKKSAIYRNYVYTYAKCQGRKFKVMGSKKKDILTITRVE